MRNQAIRKVTLPINKQASHKLVITALDEGVVLDQVILYYRSHHRVAQSPMDFS